MFKNIYVLFLFISVVAVSQEERDVFGNVIQHKHKLTYAYKKNYIAPKHLDTLIEANIIIAKRVWSYISLNDNLNKNLYNVSKPNKFIFPLIEVLEFGIITGKIKCFKNGNFSSPQNKIYSFAEIRNLLFKKDTIQKSFISEITNNDSIITVIKNDSLNAATVLGFEIKEDWYFNKRSALAEKRIIGMAPIIFDVKAQKNKEVYWVYFAECRELLSSFRALNPLGNEEIYTYLNLFEERAFNSNPIKESNVFNRNKTENSKGFEVEIENKNSKQDYLNNEDDLWNK